MICSECNEKNTRVVHCLCRLCTQKIINNANELGKKQGTVEGEIKGYRNVIFCLKKENKRFKKKVNPFINNSELEQFTREQIQEIEKFIKELKEGV